MTKSFFFSEDEIAPAKRRNPARNKRLDCQTCGLYKGCSSPKMEPHGTGELGIVVVAEAPGADEDEQGIPLVGTSGQLLRKHLSKVGLDLDRDCIKLNVVQCRPPKNRTPNKNELAACWPRVEKQIRAAKPDVILALGSPAISTVLQDSPTSAKARDMAGRAVPCNYWNAWVVCSYHPAYFKHRGGKDELLLDQAIRLVVEKTEQGFSDQRLDENQYTIWEDYDCARNYLRGLCKHKGEVAFDYETNMLSPFQPGGKILTVSFATGLEDGVCIPLQHPAARWTQEQLDGLFELLAAFLASDTKKIIQNQIFEDLWGRQKLGVRVENVCCDTMVRQHVLDERQGTTGLEYQTYVRYGTTFKGAVDVKNLERTPLDVVCKYNALDARYTWRLKQDQDSEMTEGYEQAYGLFHSALPLMASLEERGIKVDVATMDELEQNVLAELDQIVVDRQEAKVLAKYRQKYGKGWKSTSNKDKQALFYDILELEPLRELKTGYSVDVDSLKHLRTQVAEGGEVDRILAGLLNEGHLNKLHGTYIKGLRKELDPKGFLHPSFNLHIPESYRSSSSGPNFQNIPIRLKTLARVRRTMVPRNDYLLEADYSGNELRCLAMYSRDAGLIKQILDGVDPHRYWASKLFEKPEDEITGDERFDAKSSFVFPTWYGSYFVTTSSELGLPEWHVEAVEGEFWGKYKRGKKWQEELLRSYKQCGFIETFLGFRRHAPLSNNQVINSLIQGTAFHLLLDALVRIEAEMQECGFKSWMNGQIHDSGEFDVVKEEVEDVIEVAEKHLLAKRFEWMGDVPLAVEWKIGRNFLDMVAV